MSTAGGASEYEQRLRQRPPRCAAAFARADDLWTLVDRALAAVDPAQAVVRALHLGGSGSDLRLALSNAQRVRLLSVGKAAVPMARAAQQVLGERIASGLVVCKGEPVALGDLQVLAGDHPVPGLASVRAAQAVAAFADDCTAHDLLLLLLSGGASSLLCSPAAGLTLAELQVVNDLLLRSGADIAAVNCVRKHLETLKGGGLARRLAPARVLSLVLSDVIGDQLDAIGSGPCHPDTTTFRDVRAVLDHYQLWSKLPNAVRTHVEAGLRGEGPDTARASEPCFEHVQSHVIASNRTACDAARAAAHALGYEVVLLGAPITGEARDAGAQLARQLLASRGPRPVCLIAGGESTVTVHGAGRGGRNQELALGAALVFDRQPGVALLSLATDGEDGATPAAGGMVTGGTCQRVRELGFEVEAALADNASHDLFDSLSDWLDLGPTGGNVCDLVLAIAEPLPTPR